MSTHIMEDTDILLEQEKLGPLKILTQHTPEGLATALAENPEIDIIEEVDLQKAREVAKPETDFDSINFKMIAGSMKSAMESGADALFFTNEQQDQLGVCAGKAIGGPLQVLTAHQIALLLSEIKIEEHLQKAPEEKSKDPLILRSVVLTDVLEVQAAYSNVKIIQTYAGLDQLSQNLEEEHLQDYDILLALDEANHVLFPGYSPQESIAHGIQLLADKALALKKEGKTLVDFMIELYRRYGFYHEKSFTIVREGAGGEKIIKGIISDIRKQLPDILFGQSVRLVNDYNKGTFYNLLTAKKGKTTLPKADVIQLMFADNTKISFVPSEDYTKLFYHFSVSSRIVNKDGFDEAKALANERIIWMMEKIGKI